MWPVKNPACSSSLETVWTSPSSGSISSIRTPKASAVEGSLTADVLVRRARMAAPVGSGEQGHDARHRGQRTFHLCHTLYLHWNSNVQNPFTAFITLTSVSTLSSQYGGVPHPPSTDSYVSDPRNGVTDLPSHRCGEATEAGSNGAQPPFNMAHELHIPCRNLKSQNAQP